MNWDWIKSDIEKLPSTWIPALLAIMVRTAIRKKVFKLNQIHVFVKKTEEQFEEKLREYEDVQTNTEEKPNAQEKPSGQST